MYLSLEAGEPVEPERENDINIDLSDVSLSYEDVNDETYSPDETVDSLPEFNLVLRPRRAEVYESTEEHTEDPTSRM